MALYPAGLTPFTGPSDSRKQTIIEEDWITGALAGSYGWVGTLATGTIVMNTANLSATNWGIVQINSGAASTNAALLQLGTTARYIFGSAITYAEMYINLETLSSGTNDYTFRAGFMDNWTGAPNNGSYFEYISGTSVNWRYGNANGGSRTIASSSTAVAAGAWVKLGMKITKTTAEFFVNDVSLSSPVSTNFSANGTWFGIGMNKNANGTTSKYCLVDYVSIYSSWGTTR